MPSPLSARVHAEHTCQKAKSAFLDHHFGISSCNLSMLLFLYATEYPALATYFVFQDFPYSGPPDWPIFLNNTKKLTGSHCQFVSHTHWVSNYCTFMYGRWPEGSNLKLPQWLHSDYFLKLSLLWQLPQAMVSVLSSLIITLTTVVYSLGFFSSCCVLGLYSQSLRLLFYLALLKASRTMYV